MSLAAYVISGHTTRTDMYGIKTSVGCGVKVGQSTNWEKRLKTLDNNGCITPHYIFCCEKVEDAEWIESTLRRHFLNMSNAQRNGTDWIENVSAEEYELKNILKDPDVIYVLKAIKNVEIYKVDLHRYPRIKKKIFHIFPKREINL